MTRKVDGTTGLGMLERCTRATRRGALLGDVTDHSCPFQLKPCVTIDEPSGQRSTERRRKRKKVSGGRVRRRKERDERVVGTRGGEEETKYTASRTPHRRGTAPETRART